VGSKKLSPAGIGGGTKNFGIKERNSKGAVAGHASGGSNHGKRQAGALYFHRMERRPPSSFPEADERTGSLMVDLGKSCPPRHKTGREDVGSSASGGKRGWRSLYGKLNYESLSSITKKMSTLRVLAETRSGKFTRTKFSLERGGRKEENSNRYYTQGEKKRVTV